MRKILVATHGKFAAGIQETLKFIVGEDCKVEVLNAYVNEAFDMKQEAERYINALAEDDELIVAADLFGGSVANTFTEYVPTGKVHILTGVNVPMLLELSDLINSECSTEELIQSAQQTAQEGIVYVNKVLYENMNSEEDDL